jgi:hypothetical protein
VVRLPLDRLALAVLEQTEWLLSTLTSNMVQKYVILDAVGGWFVNLVLWDGNTETWQPPEGTIARLADEVDFSTLPQNPNEQYS